MFRPKGQSALAYDVWKTTPPFEDEPDYVADCEECGGEIDDYGYDMSEYGGKSFVCSKCAIDYLRYVHEKEPLELAVEDGFEDFDEWFRWLDMSPCKFLRYNDISEIDVKDYLEEYWASIYDPWE